MELTLHTTTTPNNTIGQIVYGTHTSKLGPLFIAVKDEAICALYLTQNTSEAAALKRLQRSWPKTQIAADKATTALYVSHIHDTLTRTFTGKLSLNLAGTVFQCNVWKALLDIPWGETRAYADIARAVGSPRGSRAVGQAVGANPVSIFIPCHRVIAANGSLGGYAWGPVCKQQLLNIENGEALN